MTRFTRSSKRNHIHTANLLDPKKMQEEMIRKLENYHFTHFITLSSNGLVSREERMVQLLKQWDARVNRALVGPRWQKRPDERLFWYAFLEKPQENPHWHLLAQIDPNYTSTPQAVRVARLPIVGERTWAELLSRGSFNCQPIVSKEIIRYVLKEFRSAGDFTRFVVSTEFIS